MRIAIIRLLGHRKALEYGAFIYFKIDIFHLYNFLSLLK